MKEVVCVDVPDELVAVMTKAAVPVKEISEIVTVFEAKVKLIGFPFCVTVILSRAVIFSTVAVTEAEQFSSVVGEAVGEVIRMTGGNINGQVPRASP